MSFPLGLFFVSLLIFRIANSEEQAVITSLVEFMAKLSPGDVQREMNWGWNHTSDPCTHKWKGVTCDSSLKSVQKIILDESNLTGVLDAKSLCQTSTLLVLSLVGNNVVGDLKKDISRCKNLTHLYIRGNHFSGKIDSSISNLRNLKRFVASHNSFTGELPDMSKVTGLLSYLILSVFSMKAAFQVILDYVESHCQTYVHLKNDDSDVGLADALFKMDVYSLGEILLELLTGKLIPGPDLAKWVHSVAIDEWRTQVFDKSLTSEGANEERLINLLQVALKCINTSADARPSMKQVADMINSVKEDEERSVSY